MSVGCCFSFPRYISQFTTDHSSKMELSESLTSNVDIQVQSIILAAAQHDVPQLRSLLRETSANVQDPETGQTPLHAAILACEDSPAVEMNGATTDQLGNLTDGTMAGTARETEPPDEATSGEAVKTVNYLLQNGAIWNDLDRNNETPGCIALRIGQKELYEIMVDAGVRAELLLSRLDEYERLQDSTSENLDEAEITAEESGNEPLTRSTGEINAEVHQVDPSLQSGLNQDQYLHSRLTVSESRILDSSSNGVMMAWESTIMKRSSLLLASIPNPRVLNIGHGMGIIDRFFQEQSPAIHHIIEAHPDILSRMREDGWYDRPNVTIHEGRWQDMVPKIMEQGNLFDAVYFDTFAEDYKALRDFFSDHLIGLLDDTGRWSFFNGLGADRQICYDVYQKVVEMDLFEAGFEVEWETVPTPQSDEEGEWSGVRRKYWTLKEYRLPICTFLK